MSGIQAPAENVVQAYETLRAEWFRRVDAAKADGITAREYNGGMGIIMRSKSVLIEVQIDGMPDHCIVVRYDDPNVIVIE